MFTEVLVFVAFSLYLILWARVIPSVLHRDTDVLDCCLHLSCSIVQSPSVCRELESECERRKPHRCAGAPPGSASKASSFPGLLLLFQLLLLLRLEASLT